MLNPKARASLFVLASLSALAVGVPAALARRDTAAALGAAQQVPRYQYVWRHDKGYTDRTTDPAVRAELRALAEAQPGDCIAVERAGRRYLITDPYVLTHAAEAYAPVNALGEQMGGLGKQQGEIGKQMGGIGGQMGEFGRQMGDLGKQIRAAKEAGDDTRLAEIKQQMKALGEQMKGLGGQMRPLGQQMRPLGEKMRELGKQMRPAVQDAETKMARLLDTAFVRQMAVEQK
jgi:hypothetical protein